MINSDHNASSEDTRERLQNSAIFFEAHSYKQMADALTFPRKRAPDHPNLMFHVDGGG